MNFRILSNVPLDIDEEAFEAEYLHTTISNDDLRKKYELSKKQFSEITQRIKKKHGLPRRPNTFGKHYYFNGYGYVISIIRNGKKLYMGLVHTEKLAKKCVNICDELNWEVDKCRPVIEELKQCN